MNSPAFFVSSDKENFQIADWFMRLLSARMVKGITLPFTIFYHQKTNACYSPREGIKITIPVRPGTYQEYERAFDRILNKDWVVKGINGYDLNIDLIRFAAWILNREEERALTGDPYTLDVHGRFRLEKTVAYRKGCWKKPVLDHALSFLISIIEADSGVRLINREPWKERKSKAAWLTHDVDKLMGRYALPLRVAGWVAFAIKSIAQRKWKEGSIWMKKCRYWVGMRGDPIFESIGGILHEESRIKARSTFFFMALKHGVSLHEGIRYPAHHPLVSQSIQQITENMCSIGLHPGTFKAFDNIHLTRQKKLLESITGKKVSTVRNHYLKIRFPETWRLQETAGFKISTNMGWHSPDNGFRAGTCWPFQPFDLDRDRAFQLLEVPLVYMDNIRIDTTEIFDQVISLAHEVSSVYGLLVLNFHSDMCDETGLSHKGRAYIDVLRLLKEDQWHFLSNSELEDQYNILITK